MSGTPKRYPMPRRATTLALVTACVLSPGAIGSFSAEAHTLSYFRKQRRHIKERARTQIGTPYRYGGTSPRTGFDCSGFTRWVYKRHGEWLPHNSLDQFRLARRDRYRRIWKRKNLVVGDLVFHKTTSARVGHAGIYIGRGRFISSTSSSGVRVQSIWDKYYWGPRWVGATRVPDIRFN